MNIIKNSAKCLRCGDELESVHVHDFQECSCGNVFVDGGKEYTRHGFVAYNEYENTSVVIHDEVIDEFNAG